MAKTDKKAQSAINDLVEVFDSQFFRAMSEPVRIEVLKYLLLNGKSDVASIAKTIKKDRSVLSRHLHHLSEIGVLKHERVSRHSYFEINAKEFRAKVYALFEKVDQAIRNCCD